MSSRCVAIVVTSSRTYWQWLQGENLLAWRLTICCKNSALIVCLVSLWPLEIRRTIDQTLTGARVLHDIGSASVKAKVGVFVCESTISVYVQTLHLLFVSSATLYGILS